MLKTILDVNRWRYYSYVKFLKSQGTTEIDRAGIKTTMEIDRAGIKTCETLQHVLSVGFTKKEYIIQIRIPT